MTAKKFSQAKIIYSNLLHRQDSIQSSITKVNEAMEHYCKRSNIKYLDNSHISKPHQFHDFKHLNQRGFKFFAKNLKSAIYGTATRQSRSEQSPRLPSPDFWSNRSQTPIPQAPRDIPLQNDYPTYASITASPANYQHPRQAIRPIPTSLLHPARPTTSGIINSSGLPIPLKTLIQQLQMFI